MVTPLMIEFGKYAKRPVSYMVVSESEIGGAHEAGVLLWRAQPATVRDLAVSGRKTVLVAGQEREITSLLVHELV